MTKAMRIIIIPHVFSAAAAWRGACAWRKSTIITRAGGAGQ